jgi:membrane protease YdiL (CAAX protease family)
MEKFLTIYIKTENKIYLWTEFITIFFCLPLIIALNFKIAPLPLILFGGLISFYILYNDDNFEKAYLYKLPPINIEYARIALQFILFAGLFYFFISHYFPNYLFLFIKKNFYLWINIVLIYTFLAVYPQEVIYRALIFHRYKKLSPQNNILIHLSAIAFSFGHILYLNPISLILSLLGGYIFSITYARTKSLFLVYIEHLLYGLMLYTIGFGNYFYSGIIH